MKTKFLSEFLGTAFLLMIIVGSGIMGENLANGNSAIALLANSLATGFGLFVLIQCLGSLSGAHFNPVVSFVERLWGRMTTNEMFLYWIAQISGAITGVLLTHIMFNQDILQIAQKSRNETHLWISEIIATFGLISVIALAGKKHVEFAPLTIASYIAAAYWFTSSTSFANPAVSIARSLTDTFCGIAPAGVSMFIVAQFCGALMCYFLLRKVV
ncbi:MAG: aquaporin family protein [Bdellovibrionales bacterium CG12_big_fil_rev_8_21_14_0_65_38_15]|nr:MAG: aquaporin family protein [Bdellovibrionales bacterium CG22_combo_CG10-13_8_21_14_all_38_13]PIQ55056.1 MAG: aquaporin family protein [Bdellovibrionales bacterium CG12_big_fil_rev_8_21_14_0_65_38_15]PIR30537.1 MAG: aquaporin family protein [Bdellovibrionales bacterium CG11_big_fil_rev_8_21_14_0_20_38_13]